MNVEKQLNDKIQQIKCDDSKRKEEVQKLEMLVSEIFAELGNLPPLHNNR